MQVLAVARDDQHRFSKPTVDEIRLVEALGVAGDAHHGRTVQHRSRVRRDRDAAGRLIRKAGVMAVVVHGGPLRAGDRIVVQLPPEPHVALQPV